MLKNFDSRLWFAFLLITLIPAVLNIIRLHWIGSLPSDNGFNIASQIQWLNIIYEVVQEGLLIPLFYMLSLAKKHDEKYFLNQTVVGLSLVFGIYLLLSSIIFIFAQPLIAVSQQNPVLIDSTVQYIRLESIAIMCSVAVDYLIVYLAINNEYIKIIKLSLLKISLLILMDWLLISNYSFSLQLGVNGIAISNIVVGSILTSWILIKTNLFTILAKFSFDCDRAWLKKWFVLGGFSGLESFIRNLAFAMMILAMINQIGEQGSYWIANSVIWGILLAPSLALAEVVKRDVAMDVNNIAKNTPTYFRIVGIFIAIWLLSLPFCHGFLTQILQVEKPEPVLMIIYLQSGFYFIFMINNGILDATIKGLGLNKYMLYQSFCIDIGYYGGIFILYKLGLIPMNLKSISIIFGLGITLDLIPTTYLYYKALKKNQIPLKALFHK